MNKHTSYTHRKLLEAIVEDVTACETAQDIIKLRNELLNDPDLSVEEIVSACLIGAVMNKSAQRRVKEEAASLLIRCRGTSLSFLNSRKNFVSKIKKAFRLLKKILV